MDRPTQSSAELSGSDGWSGADAETNSVAPQLLHVLLPMGWMSPSANSTAGNADPQEVQTATSRRFSFQFIHRADAVPMYKHLGLRVPHSADSEAEASGRSSRHRTPITRKVGPMAVERSQPTPETSERAVTTDCPFGDEPPDDGESVNRHRTDLD